MGVGAGLSMLDAADRFRLRQFILGYSGMHKWQTMTAVDLGRGIGAGDIDPVELCDVFLDAIAAHPFTDKIYARVTAGRARAEALAARTRQQNGGRLCPLDGVPISWKDLFDTAGTVTEAGSKLLAGRTPDADALVLRRATQMGLVCLGKTHMSELAFSGLGYNPVTATSPCVNDHDAVAGGSSSGAAASVAFGLAAAAIGSDTGGSVRIPAVWNDLVGLKTTHGVIATKGVVPLCQRFDTVGPLCRSVEDAAALFDVLGGGSVDLAHASLEGVRFGALQTVVLEGLEDAPRTAYERAVEAIKQAGAFVEPFEFEALNDAFAVAGPLFTAEAYGTWGEVIEASPDTMFDQVRERFRAGKNVAASDFVAGWQKLDQIRHEYALQAARFDGVLLPTAPIMPPNLARLIAEPDYFVETNLMALRNTRVANLLGLCSVTVPAGHKSTGLMINCLPMQDAKALRLAAAISVIGA